MFWVPAFNSFGCIPQSGVTESYGIIFLRKCHAVFPPWLHFNFPISNAQGFQFLHTLSDACYFLWFIYLIIAILMCLNWFLYYFWSKSHVSQISHTIISGSISFFQYVFLKDKNTFKIISSVQLLSHIQLFATPWTAARQASLSITNSQSLIKLMSIKSVMPSNHLILCWPLLLLPLIFPSIRVFSSESVLRIRWPKYWSFSFSISSSSEHSGLIS